MVRYVATKGYVWKPERKRRENRHRGREGGIKGGGTQRRVGRNWASDDVGEDVDRFHRIGDREC